MKPVWWLALLGSGVAASLGAAIYFELGPFGSALTKACETSLKQRLAAPSTYRRIAVYEEIATISADEFVAIERQSSSPPPEAVLEADRASILAGRFAPKRYVQTIEYDAMNGFGVPIRSASVCEYVSIGGGTGTASAYSVEIDGETSAEYIIRRVRDTQN